MIIWLSGIGSAFVDNIPLTATMIPVIQSINSDFAIAPAFGDGCPFQFSPLWWALALGADLRHMGH
jgi:Na+/H+ antiporter NhaD/arsenite permease-like protein